MPEFLVDVNLPYYFSLWNNERFVFVRNINSRMSDEQVWDYARDNNLTIISKDADFSNKIIFNTPPPKVIHIKFGNLKMNEFFAVLSKLWKEIEALNKNYKLVNVYSDRVEGID